jgi:hypothetical protein
VNRATLAAVLLAGARLLADEPAPSLETVVRGAREKSDPVSTAVRSDEAQKLAGTGGDPLKVVEDLPGVARAPAGTGQLIVWGSSPSDTRVVVDGVEIPALYHFGGLRSTLGSDLPRSVELLPGGFGAEQGRGLGGLLRVTGRRLDDAGTHAELAADLLDASAALSTTIGRVHLAASGRYSYLDRILDGVYTSHPGDLFAVPRWDDYQLRATIDLGPDEELTTSFLASDDHLTRTQPASDPGSVRSDSNDQSFYRLSARYRRLLDDGSRVEIVPQLGFDRTRQASAFGGTPARLDDDAWSYGLRASYKKPIAAPLTLAIGLDLLGTRSALSRQGSLTLPPREGDLYVFGQPPGSDVSSDDWTTHIADAGLFATAEIRFGRFTIRPGLRADAFLIEGSRITPRIAATPAIGFTRVEFALDPRLSIAFSPSEKLLFTASAGLYHQPPAPQDLSAVFGNPSLGLSRALHVTAGAAVKPIPTLTVEATGFYKALDGLASRSVLDAPILAQALVPDGSGRSYGGQLLVRQELWHHLFGWVTYTVSRSERQDHPGGPLRLFDYDQTHVLAALATVEYRGFTGGLRFRYSTGVPRTPVLGGFFDARDDEYQPIFGAQNSIRLPDFVQLDARIEKEFVFRRVSLRLYLEVQNVTFHSNAEEIIYRFDYSGASYLKGLPTLAVLGGRLHY